MAIDFTCPQCGSEIEADETVGGSRAQCPKCHGTVLIPRQGIRPGMTVGSYRIERKLGVGGMGEVWLAQHTAMHRAVALKILSPAMTADPEFVERFLHEVYTAAKLEHPNIVTAFDAGEDGDIHYLAVSYVDGEEVGKRLQRQKVLPEKEALTIARGVAEALGYAWSKFRMLHRDIKPANIMITADGVPKLMDMGISKSMAEDVQMTMTGYIVGTPYYMSPEQARAETEIDFRSDIYALGATLYHLVTGTLPFGGTTAMAVLTRQITEPLESPRKRNPAVSEGCAALIEAMMAKDPRDRPASWEEVVQDIDRVLQGAMPTTRRPQVGRSVVARMTPEELKSLRTGRHRVAVSASELQQARQAPAPVPSRRSSAKPILIAAAVLAVVAGAGVAVFLAARGNRQSQPVPPPVAAVPATAPVPTPPPAQAADKTAEMWEYAVQYAKENPQQYEMAMGNFRTVKAQAAGTKYQMMADVEIARLEQAQRTALGQAAARALEDLRAKAQPLADRQDFFGAAAVYASYAGPMAKETEAERTKLAEEYGKRARQLTEEKDKTQQAARQKLEQTLSAAATDLLGGKTEAEALVRVQALARETLPAAEQDQARKAAELLLGLSQADETVLKSFEAQAGKDVAVPLPAGVQQLKIAGVKDGVVQAERQVGPATVGVTFNVWQLPAEERCRRLEGRAASEICALYAGLCAHARGADPEASKLLAGAGVLAPPLQAALGGAEQARKEALARQGLAKALQPLGVTGDDLAWTVVSNQLQKAKLSVAAAAAGQSELEAYRKEHGATAYAAGQKELLDQLAAFLAAKAAPPEPPVVPPTPARVVGTSPYKTAAALNAALKAANPDYKGDGQFVVENRQIVEVVLGHEKAITDISPLRGLPLRNLLLSSAVNITDFSPLAGMPLRVLSLNGCSRWDDSCMPMLAAMPLEDLTLRGTKVSDLSALQGKKLMILCLGDTHVANLEPLRGMPLNRLDILRTPVADIGVLKGMPLVTLEMSSSQVADIGVLAGSTVTTLCINDTPISDLSPLRGTRLERLSFTPRNIKAAADILMLRKMHSLNEIKTGVEKANQSPAEFWKKYDAGEYK